MPSKTRTIQARHAISNTFFVDHIPIAVYTHRQVDKVDRIPRGLVELPLVGCNIRVYDNVF